MDSFTNQALQVLIIGVPILLISGLALHTRNILADSRVSLMLDERAPGDPLEGARIMLAGIAEKASSHPKIVQLAGVGLQVDWDWDQVIASIKEL